MFKFALTAPVLAAILSAFPAFAQDTLNLPHIGEVIRKDAAFDKLVAPNAKIQVLASGFKWAEGPVWVNDDQHKFGGFVLFSDIPNNRVVRWDEGEGANTWLKPSGYTGVAAYGGEPGCNGLALDSKGQLISCEHGDRRLSVLTKGGGKRTLVDNYRGKRLNSPNDVAVHPDGSLYFTDPPYGLPNRYESKERELDFCGVYRLSPQGELTLLTDKMTRPNGIAFSPDYKTLYVAQSDPAAAIINAFPVNADGSVGAGKKLYDVTNMVGSHPGLPDGLKVDKDGNLWATCPGGVHVIDKNGKLLGRISTGEKTANCGWGNDGSTLYLTADMYLCRIKTLTKGAGW